MGLIFSATHAMEPLPSLATKLRSLGGRQAGVTFPASKRLDREPPNGWVLQVIRATLAHRGKATPEVERSSPSRAWLRLLSTSVPLDRLLSELAAPGLPTQNSEGPIIYGMARTIGAMHVAKISRSHGDREYDSYPVRRSARAGGCAMRRSRTSPSFRRRRSRR